MTRADLIKAINVQASRYFGFDTTVACVSLSKPELEKSLARWTSAADHAEAARAAWGAGEHQRGNREDTIGSLILGGHDSDAAASMAAARWPE